MSREKRSGMNFEAAGEGPLLLLQQHSQQDKMQSLVVSRRVLSLNLLNRAILVPANRTNSYYVTFVFLVFLFHLQYYM